MRIVKTLSLALVLATFLSSSAFSATSDRITGAIDASRTVALANSLHPRAQQQYDRGPVDPSFQLTYMTLVTAPSPTQQAKLNKLLAAQQDSASPQYHHWLTPAQYADQFGLSQNDMNRITGWLKAQGFKVISIAGGRNTVVFSGSAGQVQRAFGTEIHQFSINGEQHFANATPLNIPAALNGVVTGVRGVHNFRMHSASRLRPGTGPRTRSQYYLAGGYAFPNYLAPADVEVIYDTTPLINDAIDGTGETLAIVGRTDVFLADINDFRSAFGLTPISASNCTLNTATSTTANVITACDDSHFKYVLILAGGTDPLVPDSVEEGDITEADLDIEWSGAVAQNAQVVYINSPNTDVTDSLAYALDPPQGTPIPAPVVSMSFGGCELVQTPFMETELMQGASEGVTVVNSSGDSGAAACDDIPFENEQPFSTGALDGYAVNYPASSPWVTAVGGTAITLANDSYPSGSSSYWNNSNGTNDGSAKSYIPETPWNDDETWLSYCQDPVEGDTFCAEGDPITEGWVPITSVQTAQEDIWINAGGGGASNCYTRNGDVCTGGIPRPSWQSSLSISGLPAFANTGVRFVPDVSFLASPNFPGYIFCTPQDPDALSDPEPVYTSTCVNGISGTTGAILQYNSLIGGTSVSAPVFAGIVTLLNQRLFGASSPGLGSINAELYLLAKSRTTNKAFNPQPTSGDNMVYCAAGQPASQTTLPSIKCPTSGTAILGFSVTNSDTATGYNLVTGLGSVDAGNLASTWANSRSASSVSLASSASSTYQGASVTLTATVTPSSATGNVIFQNGATVVGSAVIASGTAAVSTSSLPLGADSITASYIGSGTLATSTSTATTVTVTQAFTLTPGAQTYTVNPGSGATVNITLTTSGGFNSALTYTCSDAAPESSCTGPSGPTTQSSVSFAITTTAATADLRRPDLRHTGHGSLFYATFLPGLLGIVFTVGSRKRSLRGMRLLGLILVLGFSTLWLGSCGGSNGSGSGNQGTTPGNYSIVINASGGGASGTVTVTLDVQ